jgi:hypothetical protein
VKQAGEPKLSAERRPEKRVGWIRERVKATPSNELSAVAEGGTARGVSGFRGFIGEASESEGKAATTKQLNRQCELRPT